MSLGREDDLEGGRSRAEFNSVNWPTLQFQGATIGTVREFEIHNFSTILSYTFVVPGQSEDREEGDANHLYDMSVYT